MNEVGADSIQFLHKTFQEYFAALEVVYQQDEIHVAKDFDLRSWGELYLIVLSIAPRGVAAEMVRIVFERAGSSAKDWAAYVLLAGAGCREVPEVSPSLKHGVSEQVQKLIPPHDLSTVYQLAEMGSLVLPFLQFRNHYGRVESDHIVTLLGLIDDSDSAAIIEEYAAKACISLDTVEGFLEGFLGIGLYSRYRTA